MAARAATAAVIEADPFGYDPSVHEKVRPALRFLFERYWRVDVQGIEHLPRYGPALLVANHSGAIPLDAAMIGAAVEFRGKSPRLVRFLFDRFVGDMPLMGDFFTKLGSVPASYDNGVALLQRGELVGLFPEGVAGVAKGFGKRYRLQAFRTGFVRMSLAEHVPIVPVIVVGAEETYPVIGKWQTLGPLQRLLNVPYVPITPLFPWLGLLGMIPLPSRWQIRFLPPIHLADDLRRLRIRSRTVGLLAQQVRREMQAGINESLARRRSMFT